MQVRDVVFLLLLALVGFFLWKRIQALSLSVASLAATNQTGTAALSGRVDSVVQANKQLSTQVATVQASDTDAPDFVAQFDALMDASINPYQPEPQE